jgi:hypothetical protein
MEMMHRTDDSLVQKWEPVLEGIDSDYISLLSRKDFLRILPLLLPPLVSLVLSKSSLSLSFVGFTHN